METDLYVRIDLPIILTLKVGLWISTSICLIVIISCMKLAYTYAEDLQVDLADIVIISQ
jgi:hypothetical protein